MGVSPVSAVLRTITGKMPVGPTGETPVLLRDAELAPSFPSSSLGTHLSLKLRFRKCPYFDANFGIEKFSISSFTA